jgi:hypothetical protein
MGAGHFLQNQNVHMTVIQQFYLTSDISEFEVLINESVVTERRIEHALPADSP